MRVENHQNLELANLNNANKQKKVVQKPESNIANGERYDDNVIIKKDSLELKTLTDIIMSKEEPFQMDKIERVRQLEEAGEWNVTGKDVVFKMLGVRSSDK